MAGPVRQVAVGRAASDSGLETCTQCLFCNGREVRGSITDVTDEFFKADDGKFDFLNCAECGSLWLAQRPVGKRLVDAYATYYTHGHQTTNGAAAGALRGWIRAAYIRNQQLARPGLLDRIVASAVVAAGYDTSPLDRGLRFVPRAPARILDYGCGSGTFLAQFTDLGYELHGAEYDPHLLGELKNLGISIHDVASLTDETWEGYFDYITLTHVLEHVPDPQGLLKRLFGWLKPGGRVYLDLPNADATGLSIFGRFWRGLEAPRHFSLPSREALVAVLKATGFMIERQHIGPIGRSWMWEKSLSASPPGKQSALREAMRSAPPETETNAEMLIFVARKPG